MFTGIVQGIATLSEATQLSDIIRWKVKFPGGALNDIQVGASISLDGCCLTVTEHSDDCARFDVVPETLQRTSFNALKAEAQLNFERSLRFGDEVGGHILSGHVDVVATIRHIEKFENSRVITFSVPTTVTSTTAGASPWISYIFEKGYVAINGASLTVTHVDRSQSTFKVSLIPETLEKTTFPLKEVGAFVNIEIDRTTQVIVDTVQRIQAERLSNPSGNNL